MSHIDLLQFHELKATSQRLCVLETLQTCGHATLDEIQAIAKEKFPTLSLSTIYRNLNEMIKKGIVSEVKLANKKEHFELVKDNHTHLVCTHCGSIEDFKLETNEFIKNVETLSGSKVLTETMSFDVICKKCQ
jgi:Fur family peroxide stress response transcriptional regulator